MQRFQVLQDRVVNVVVPRRILEHGLLELVRIGNSQPRKRDVALIPDGHRGFAVAVHGHVAVIVDGGYAFVAAVILGPARHVLAHDRRKITQSQSTAARRRDAGKPRAAALDRRHARVRFPGAGIPCAIQPEIILYSGELGRETPSAAVRNRQRGLQQDQTLRRFHPLGPARQRLVSECVVIGFRIVAPQRQLESVFARGRAVARSGVAAHFGHHGQDVVAKAPGQDRGVTLHVTRRAGALAPARPRKSSCARRLAAAQSRLLSTVAIL